jgi:tetratricopeptide (TPR) repeat protein
MSKINEILFSVSEIEDVEKRISQLCQIGHEKYNGDTTLVIELAEHIISESKANAYIDGEALGNNLLGLCHFTLGNHEKSVKYYSVAVNLLDNSLNTILKGTVLNNLGNLFNQLGDIEKALVFYTDAYQIYSKTSELNKLNVIIMNIGVIYLRTKNHKTGIAYLKRSKEFFEESKDLLNLCNAANIIGVGLFTIGNYDEAKVHFVESLEYAIQIDDKTNACRANLYLGLIALKEIKLNEANSYFHNSMKIAIENDMKVARVFNYKGFAEMYALGKQYENALEQLNYAFSICEDLNLKEEKIEIYFLYSDIYKQMGAFEKAYQSLFAYKELKEKFLEEENTYKIQKLQITNQIQQITREKELAEQASAAKSNFLSKMSH